MNFFYSHSLGLYHDALSKLSVSDIPSCAVKLLYKKEHIAGTGYHETQLCFKAHVLEASHIEETHDVIPCNLDLTPVVNVEVYDCCYKVSFCDFNACGFLPGFWSLARQD